MQFLLKSASLIVLGFAVQACSTPEAPKGGDYKSGQSQDNPVNDCQTKDVDQYGQPIPKAGCATTSKNSALSDLKSNDGMQGPLILTGTVDASGQDQHNQVNVQAKQCYDSGHIYYRFSPLEGVCKNTLESKVQRAQVRCSSAGILEIKGIAAASKDQLKGAFANFTQQGFAIDQCAYCPAGSQNRECFNKNAPPVANEMKIFFLKYQGSEFVFQSISVGI